MKWDPSARSNTHPSLAPSQWCPHALECPFCPGTPKDEDHLFAKCPHLEQLWARLLPGEAPSTLRDTPPRLSGCCSLLFLKHLATLRASPSSRSSRRSGMPWPSTATTSTPQLSLDSYHLTSTSGSVGHRASLTLNHSSSGVKQLLM
jgi:hypothetical protein